NDGRGLGDHVAELFDAAAKVWCDHVNIRFSKRFQAQACPAKENPSNEIGRADNGTANRMGGSVGPRDRPLRFIEQGSSRRLGDRFLWFPHLFGLLDLGDGRGLRLLHGLAVLRELFQFRLELGATHGDLLEQLVGGVLAKACEFFDAQRIQIDLCQWNLPFSFRYRDGAQATSSAVALSTAFALQPDDHNPATPLPNSRPNRNRQ
ncbi:MAG: hypothetical protein ACREDP_17075, partial [Bradyrhizobium sp.]